MIKYNITRVDTDDDSGHVEPVPRAEPSWQRLIGVGDVITDGIAVTEQNVAEIMATFVERPVLEAPRSRGKTLVADRCLGWIWRLERRADEVFAFVRWTIEPAEVSLIRYGLAAVVMTSARDPENGVPLGWVLVEAFPRSFPPQIQGESPCKTP